MIRHLGIDGLGVIRAADIDLHPGLVVFTGETGAGKTMVVSALGLILGDRFDTALLGAEGTRVDAVIDLPADSPAVTAVTESGGRYDIDDDTRTAELVIGRVVPRSGRGRATAGGVTVPVSLLSEIGGSLAQRHSQSDQLQLRSARRQRAALDRFAGPEAADLGAQYNTRYREYLKLTDRLVELTRAGRDRSDRIARLRAELADIDDVAPVPAEDEQLSDAITRLANAEALNDDMSTALALIGGDDAAVSALAAAAERVRHAARFDPSLQTYADRLLTLHESSRDLAGELRTYTDSLSADPAALEALHLRKARLTPLLRRFGPSVDDVLAHADTIRAELAGIDGGEQAVEQLRTKVSECLTALAATAERLTRAREKAADSMSQEVTDELAGLAMPDARFSVEVEQRPDDKGLSLSDGRRVAFGEAGVDVVRFLLSPHPGAAAAPVGEGASGGELSRIMLALEVVLAASAPPGVFIFDEVDAGIGGRTAVEVGRRLARLATRSQVLVVTHLPQVASFADQHIVVRKGSDGMVTATSVTEVTGQDRTTELSRMLSGQPDSAAALAHAKELLELAGTQTHARSRESAQP